MSDERDFERRVMAAAGVVPREECKAAGDVEVWAEAWKTGQYVPIEHVVTYPDPLTPEGFVALWDALEARGWFVHWDSRTQPPRYAVTLLQYDYQHHTWKPGSARGNEANRAAALLEAAAQALGVTRG